MGQTPPQADFPDDIDRQNLHTEQSLDPMRHRSMQLPHALDPIGHIETEGRALRNLSSGRLPLWVLMCSWATIGLMAFVLIGVFIHALNGELEAAIATDQLTAFLWRLPIALLGLLPPGVLLLILLRATWRR